MAAKEKISAAPRGQGAPHEGKAQKRFEDLYRKFLQALGEIQLDGQKRYEKAHTDYLQTLNGALLYSQKAIEEDNRAFVGTMQEAWGQENAQTLFAEAYSKVVEDLQNRQTAVQKNSESARQNYMSSLQEVSQNLQKLYIDECRNYLREMKKAWAELDVDTIDVNTLATITQTMTAASNYLYSAFAAKQ
jgi:hypothetical protein